MIQESLFITEKVSDWKSRLSELSQKTGKNLDWLRDCNFKVANTRNRLEIMTERLKDAEFIAIDTETTGLTFNDRVVSIQLSSKKGEAYFIPVRMKTMKNVPIEDVLEVVKPLLESETGQHTLITFNGKFDCIKLRNLNSVDNGIDIFKSKSKDMKIFCKLQDPDKNTGLKLEVEKWLRTQMFELEDYFPKRSKIDFPNAPDWFAVPYACSDVERLITLYHYLEKDGKLDHENFIVRLEHEVERITADMEQRGNLINVTRLEEAKRMATEEMNETAKYLQECLGEGKRINSTRDVGTYIVEELHEWLPKTETGQYSTDKANLEPLALKHKFVAELLRYRTSSKLVSAFLVKLPEYLDRNNRIHPSFNPLGAHSGRYTCVEPNWQQLPKKRSEDDSEFKQAIRGSVIPPEGYILFDQDYEQVEYRVFAWYCKDPFLISELSKGTDFHQATAAMIYNVPMDKVTKDMRTKAKTINFAQLFGQGTKGLAEKLRIGLHEAEELQFRYFERLPKAKEWIEQQHEKAMEKKYVKSMYGRKRFIKEFYSKERAEIEAGKRKSINTPVQSTAADVLKIGLVRLSKAIKDHNIDAHIIAVVHDEVLLELKITPQLEEHCKILKEAFTVTFKNCPFSLDCAPALGYDWNDLIEIADFDFKTLGPKGGKKKPEPKIVEKEPEEDHSGHIVIDLPNSMSVLQANTLKTILAEHGGDTEIYVRKNGATSKAKSTITISDKFITEVEQLGLSITVPEGMVEHDKLDWED